MAVELGYLGVACLSVGIVALIISSRGSALKIALCLFVLGASISDPVLLYPSVLAVVVLAWAAEESAVRFVELDRCQGMSSRADPLVVVSTSSQR